MPRDERFLPISQRLNFASGYASYHDIRADVPDDHCAGTNESAFANHDLIDDSRSNADRGELANTDLPCQSGAGTQVNVIAYGAFMLNNRASVDDHIFAQH